MSTVCDISLLISLVKACHLVEEDLVVWPNLFSAFF